jgi:signal transduction histidine kinase
VKVKHRRHSNSRKIHRPKAGKRPRGQAQRGRQEMHLTTLNQLVQVLSHETRNILGSFVTCLELLRRSAQLNKDDRDLVDILQSGSRRLNEISEQFAAFGPRPPLRLEPVDLAAVISHVIERLRRDEQCSAKLEIRVEYDRALGQIAADRNLLGKVFWNLFLNAVQAMGERGTLEIETKQSDGNVEIYVCDTGPGIPTPLRGKIFEPLFTTKTRATGLGLAIARRIAEEHGGELRLQTGQETGSIFKLTLPSRSDKHVPLAGAPDGRAAPVKMKTARRQINSKHGARANH